MEFLHGRRPGRKLRELEVPIDLEEIRQKKLQAQVAVEPVPPLTLEDHRFLHEWNPGHKFAHLFKKKNGSGKANGYSIFVREQIQLSETRSTFKDAYNHFGPKWQALPEETKKKYKAEADRSNGKKEAKHPTMTEEQLKADAFRLEFGIRWMNDDSKIRLFWPPEPSGQRRLRGREHLEDLKLVRSLYITMEKQEREKEEKLMKEIEIFFQPNDFLKKRVYVISCVPVADDPAPTKCVHQPLEIYLTFFNLTEGLCDLGYHRYIRAGEGLTYEEGANLEARKAVWLQAHQKHNLPYIGFDAFDKSFNNELADLEFHYDGWDLYAGKVLKVAENHLEIYSSIVEMLKEDIDRDGNIPPIFTKLKDCQMVQNCLEWLRQKAVKEAVEYEMENDFPEGKVLVNSLEHLAWHIGKTTKRNLSEKIIETELNSIRFAHDYRLRCQYHEKRSNQTVCARSTVLCDVFNTFELLLKVCGIPKTANHVPYG